ncbi:MAG TPA: electron transport complex subunit E [Candidatus Acidoferrum sp.]|nr:electron transport complex subunit E [Candidatus Acidoferrum sp.]
MSEKQGVFAQLADGLVSQNPVLVQLLGMCPTLATSTSVKNGLGMGIAATAVLICSNIAISMLRKIIPEKVRIACYIVVVAGFVTCVDLLLQAFVPALSKSLGVFIPLIVVNCIILARAEAFANKNSVWRSAIDGLGMGLGFTFALLILGTIREVLGSGTWYGMTLIPGFKPAAMLITAPGGFLSLGCLIALVQFLLGRKGKKKEAA